MQLKGGGAPVQSSVESNRAWFSDMQFR